MKSLALIFFLFLVFSCDLDERKSNKENQTNKLADTETNQSDDQLVDSLINKGNDQTKPPMVTKKKFKYGHTNKFYPGIFRGEELTLIDSSFHHTIISQIEGYSYLYSDKPQNYYISKQNNINGLRAVTVSIYWDLCYEVIMLLLLDQDNRLINYFDLTEWRSTCDFSSTTITRFINDSTFFREVETLEPGYVNYITELYFMGKINQNGQMDTLEIFRQKEYEQE